MFGFLKKLFGMGPSVDFAELKANGALILDVRTKGEYNGGHIPGSMNIPLDQLDKNIKKLGKTDRAIITCCASGMRSASARQILRGYGFENVHNGGSWSGLQSKIG